MSNDQPTRRVYRQADGRYVISESSVWLPGVYADEQTAQRAFDLPYRTLHELQERVNATQTDYADRFITMEMLEAMTTDEKVAFEVHADRATLHEWIEGRTTDESLDRGEFGLVLDELTAPNEQAVLRFPAHAGPRMFVYVVTWQDGTPQTRHGPFLVTAGDQVTVSLPVPGHLFPA